MEQARSRASKMEKERNRLQIEIQEVVTELEEVIIMKITVRTQEVSKGGKPNGLGAVADQKF